MNMKKRSSQWTQLMKLRKEAWKKFRTSTGFEPVTSRLPVRCSTNWAMKPLTLGAGQLWVHMFPWKKWVLMIYEINHIWTAEMKWRWRNDRRSEQNLCNYLVDAQEPHALDTARTTGTLTLFKSHLMSLTNSPFLLRRAYINRCSICKAYKGLKETTPKYIISS